MTTFNNFIDRFQNILSVIRFTPFDTSTPGGRSKERYRRIVLNTTGQVMGRVFGILLNLVSVPLILDYLGKDQYGLFVTITSVLVWLTLFDFGIINGLVNSISEAFGKDDRVAAASYVTTAFYLLIALALVGVLGFSVIVRFIPWADVFAVRGTVDEAFLQKCVVAAIIPIFIKFPFSIIPQIYAGYQKSYVSSFFFALGSLVTILALWLGIRLNVDMPILIVIFGGSSIIALIVNLIYTIGKDMPWLRIRFQYLSKRALRRLLDTSVPLFLFQVGGLLVNQTQLVVLAHTTNLSVVADYSILMRLYSAYGGVLLMATRSFVPSFREAYDRGDHVWIRKGFTRMVLIRLMLASLAAASLILIGNLFLKIWLHQDSISFGIGVWIVMALLMVSSTWSTSFSDLLIILDHIWIQVFLVLLNGVSTLALTILLSSNYGVLGATFGLTFVTTFILSWLLPVLARSIFNQQPEMVSTQQ
jgi:O-antigen/teichoic acid export membrane protein